MQNLSKYFKFPLEESKNGIGVRTSDNHSALDFLISDSEFKDTIVKVLNGEIKSVPDKYKSRYKYDCCEIYRDNHKVMRIRGWRHLTGKDKGSLGLSTKDAIKVQDEFGEFIINKLNNVKNSND